MRRLPFIAVWLSQDTFSLECLLYSELYWSWAAESQYTLPSEQKHSHSWLLFCLSVCLHVHVSVCLCSFSRPLLLSLPRINLLYAGSVAWRHSSGVHLGMGPLGIPPLAPSYFITMAASPSPLSKFEEVNQSTHREKPTRVRESTYQNQKDQPHSQNLVVFELPHESFHTA